MENCKDNNNLVRTTITIESKPIDVLVSPINKEIWMDTSAICSLYQKDRMMISRIINNIKEDFASIDEATVAKLSTVQGPTVAKLSTVRNEGNRDVKRIINHYNFEAIKHIGNALNSYRWMLLKEDDEKSVIQESIDNPIIIYNNGNLQLDVRISPKEETVWLTQNQIAMLYETTRQNVGFHIKNIVDEGELDENCASKDSLPARKFYLPARDSSKTAHNYWLLARDSSKSNVKQGNQYSQVLYNLDMILAIGYRVKSKRAIEFRRWVSTVMKQYLIQGYALNEKRIESHNECLLNVIEDVSHLKQDIKELKQEVFAKPPKENLIYEGQFYNSFAFVNNLICSAKKRVIIIDGYADDKLFDYFINSSKNISKTVYCHKPERISKEALERFQLQYGNISIIENRSFHDRFLIIDDDRYILGTSLNALGTKRSCVVKLEKTSLEDLLKTTL